MAVRDLRRPFRPLSTPTPNRSALVCCRRCLFSEAGDATEASADPPFESISDHFPTGETGVAMILLLNKLDSLALNRATIEAIVEYLETNGVDLFLTLDRLIDEPTVEPYLDLPRRRAQLEQLLT